MSKSKLSFATIVLAAVAALLVCASAVAARAEHGSGAYKEFGPIDQLGSGQNPKRLIETTGTGRLRPDLRSKRKADAAPSGPVAGVSQATLDAIAACESGGDPTAVNAGGYYGKYQFDFGTWASVGGKGNPADASEGEQDYRASLLYQRAGASPWPVCGQ